MIDQALPLLRAVVVAVPARDEEDLIERSLRSVLAAADGVGNHPLARRASVHVVVACDGCTDATVGIALRLASIDPRVTVIDGAWHSAGAARAAAIRAGLIMAGAADGDPTVWLATTDADTVVSEGWLHAQVDCWASGDHAIAGVVELLDDAEQPAEVSAMFRSSYAVGHVSHDHVHGANLGVRADAYAAVGGFGDLALAEDHALWRALLGGGFRCRSSVSLRVATSARLRSRAPGGFADTLRTLVTAATVDAFAPADGVIA